MSNLFDSSTFTVGNFIDVIPLISLFLTKSTVSLLFLLILQVVFYLCFLNPSYAFSLLVIPFVINIAIATAVIPPTSLAIIIGVIMFASNPAVNPK